MLSVITPVVEDLAPGDQVARTFDFRGIEIAQIQTNHDPLFKLLYQKLWHEFGEKGEMETEDILKKRLSWHKTAASRAFDLRYEMLGLMRDSQFIAVRDHSVIVPRDPALDVIVHLSHVLIAPVARGKGLVCWLRAFPLQLVRRTLKELNQNLSRQVTLVCEMEPLDPSFPDRIIRLKSYAKAGFLMVDPSSIHFLQPDFSSPEVIDKKGGPTPLPLRLIIRRVGQESDHEILAKDVKNMVRALYAMYSECFRDSDMKIVRDSLAEYPSDLIRIKLLSPLADLGTNVP